MEGENNICGIVRQLESNFVSGTTHKSEYVDESLYEDINKIEAYLNSKHTSGPTDSLGRDKPFANICVGARNIWYRATDIDRKNVRIKATKQSDVLAQYIATAHIQDWMRRENFGTFLNVWGLNSASYNYAVTKFVEQDGRLIPSNVPWTRIICDQIDFDANPKIEILDLTEGQLRKRKGYDQTMVEKLCEAVTTRKTLDGTNKDQNSNYIRVYEVHGEFPVSCLTGKESDEDTYAQQMHVVSYVAGKEKGEYEDFTLVSGREKDPYLLTYLIPSTDGSVSLNGAVKNLFEAQWMLNHSAKAIKDQLDLASKILFQTSDGNFVGQNALFAMETGDILIHAQNQPLEQVNNGSHDVASLQSNAAFWKSLGMEINGINDAMVSMPKSGTAWRQTEAVLQESHDLFELMTQNKKLHMEEMMRRFVIPYVKKKMDTTKEIAVTLSDYGIDKIESIYIKNSAIRQTNKKIIDTVLKGGWVTPEEQDAMHQQAQADIQSGLSQSGTQRFLKPSDISEKTWKEVMKDFEWDVEVDIPGENSDTQEAMTTMNTLISMLADPMKAPFFETPRGKFILSKSLQLTGTVSPIELAEFQSMPSPQPMQQQPSPGGGSMEQLPALTQTQ